MLYVDVLKTVHFGRFVNINLLIIIVQTGKSQETKKGKQPLITDYFAVSIKNL
jgi:hypothetical protein